MTDWLGEFERELLFIIRALFPKRKRWKGSSRDFYKSKDWAQLRYEALKRDGGRCQLCGRSSQEGAVLNVDHIKPLHRYPHLALDLRNLQTLCRSCNRGKGGWDKTCWRKP